MTSCICGHTSPTEKAAAEHARTCPVSGYPKGWRDRCPVPLAGDRRSPCGLPMPCREHGEAS